MIIPAGMNEDQVLAAINVVVDLLAPDFVFGIHELDDMKQFGRWEALKLLEKGKYDPSLPLANYVYRHLHRRYINFQRDHLWRNDPPCKGCHKGELCNGDMACQRHVAWHKRNAAKASLARPRSLDLAPEKTRDCDVVSEAEKHEAENLIDLHLLPDLRVDYLRLKAGINIPSARKTAVITAVREILGCHPNEDD